ncbi:MAG: hypothetical protein QM503_12235 [Bacteroidota bacterium]
MEKNSFWYTDKYGGQGPHCSFNAKLIDDDSDEDDQTTSKKIYTHDSGALCTMFFRDDDTVDSKGKFCEHSEPRLVRTNLSKGKMNRNGWGWY